MWAGPGAELWLPPVPEGTLIGLEVRPAPGDEPLVVEIGHGGGSFEIDGRAAATRLWTWTTEVADGQPLVVRFDRAAAYPPGGADERPLAVQLLDVVVRPPGSAWAGSAATESERAGLQLELDGGYGAETFGELGRGVWLEPESRLKIVVDEPGRVVLRLAAPRPTAADPRIVIDNEMVAGPVAMDHREAEVSIPVDEAAVERGVIEFDLVSDAYRPSAEGGTDTRELGVVLLEVGFEPAELSAGWWNER